MTENSKNIKIAGIFLAAGTSSRMGKVNKLLLEFNQKTIVEHTFLQIQNSSLNEIFAIIGHEQYLIKTVLKKYTENFIYNPKFKSGMTSSIQAGILATDRKTTAFMICLSDMVFLESKDYNLLISNFKNNFKNQPLIIAPCLDNKIGNPIIFSHHFKDEILQHKAVNGCKEIVKSNLDCLIKTPLNNPLAFQDIDTMDKYLEYKN